MSASVVTPPTDCVTLRDGSPRAVLGADDREAGVVSTTPDSSESWYAGIVPDGRLYQRSSLRSVSWNASPGATIDGANARTDWVSRSPITVSGGQRGDRK